MTPIYDLMKILSTKQLKIVLFLHKYFSQSPLCVRYHLFQFPAEESEVQKGRHLSRVTQLSLSFSCQRLYRFSSFHTLPYSFSTQLQKYSSSLTTDVPNYFCCLNCHSISFSSIHQAYIECLINPGRNLISRNLHGRH